MGGRVGVGEGYRGGGGGGGRGGWSNLSKKNRYPFPYFYLETFFSNFYLAIFLFSFLFWSPSFSKGTYKFMAVR